MSFTGDLQHLPIVDVIQLLHSTRKSGALTVRGRKGESQLVFSEGFIVSANHLNNAVRIGELLVERGAVTRPDLARALSVQAAAGDDRQPLIATLLELEAVEERKAYAGLQELIEMTIVEILTWKSGSFTLEAETAKTADGYQFNPTKIRRHVNVDTQGVLMDALRIFDEKVRDGEIQVDDEAEVEPEITADDLGLADLDQLERRIPGVFAGLDDQAAAPEDNPVRRLNVFIEALPQVRSLPQLALAQLGYVGETFPRALTLVVRGGELVAEKGVGFGAGEGAAPLPGFRVPLDEPSRLREAVESGRLYWGPVDELVRSRVFPHVGASASGEVLLLPVQGEGRTVFLTFADFGDQSAGEVPVDLLEMLAGQSSQALARLLRRKNA